MEFPESENKEKVHLKSNVGLVTGCSLIVGGIIGKVFLFIFFHEML